MPAPRPVQAPGRRFPVTLNLQPVTTAMKTASALLQIAALTSVVTIQVVSGGFPMPGVRRALQTMTETGFRSTGADTVQVA